MAITRSAARVSDDRHRGNKALVLEGMTSLFQHHDASSMEHLIVQGGCCGPGWKTAW